jgi:hypothetical protein
MLESPARVGIVHRGRAFLPEVHAYKEYLEHCGHFEVDVHIDVRRACRTCDVVIVMMGFHPFWKSAGDCSILVEYHSLSTGRLRRLKDLVKRALGTRGDWYIALDQNVVKRLRLPADRTLIRPMGVPNALLTQRTLSTREFGAIYAGSVGRPGVLEHLCQLAALGLPVHVYGNTPEAGASLRSRSANIVPHGVVPQDVVIEAMLTLEFGINYTPDRHPWNAQDSTKVLEYAAAGLKIITNRYAWVNEFEAAREARFLDIESVRSLDEIQRFDFVTPNVADLEWSQVLDRSRLKDVLAHAARHARSELSSHS